MRFLARVCPTMYAQVVLRDEAFAANIANMWLLAGVLAQMHCEISLARHGLTAHRAHVFILWFHVAVSLHVHQQYLPPRETLVA